jgi:rubrerythrin
LPEWTLEKALRLALKREEASIRLYTAAQDKVLNRSSIELLKEFITEEEKHKSKILEVIKQQEKAEELGVSKTETQDLKIVDYLKDVPLSPDADYQQMLVYAGKREKAAYDFYMQVAEEHKGNQIGKTFTQLAQEELKHKQRLEQEYDDIILKQM